MYCLKYLLPFDIPLYYYINLRSLVVCCSFGHIYLYFSISLKNFVFSVSLSYLSELLCGELYDTFVILSAIFNFEAVLSPSAADYLA